MPHLSIIIPCYNEARRMGGTLPRLARSLASGALSRNTHEVLLIVEKSTDATLGIARDIAAAHPGWQAIDNQVHRGKGYAVRSGIRRATGDFVCFMDADLSSDPAAMHDALALLEARPEIAMVAGDRRHPESIVTRNQGESRRLFSRVFNLGTRALFPLAITTRDTQCGLKMFRAAAAREIFARATIDGFAFDVEIHIIARRLGFKTAAIPVRWTDAPHSTVRALRHGAQMCRDLLRLRLRPRPRAAGICVSLFFNLSLLIFS